MTRILLVSACVLALAGCKEKAEEIRDKVDEKITETFQKIPDEIRPDPATCPPMSRSECDSSEKCVWVGADYGVCAVK